MGAEGGPAPGMMLGTYRLERLLGRGGLGSVFLAYDTRLRRYVAIKMLGGDDDPAAAARLLREARSAAALNHPHICTVHDVTDAGGTPFMAMEYVEGQSLRERLDEGPLPLHDALRLGVQAAGALAYAHEHGVVHRDFKAANAILGNDGRLRIVDFGLAHREVDRAGEATTMASLAATGTVAGTSYTMAPEQVRGDVLDPHVDVWALGVLLFEMLAGRPPFAGPTLPELFAAILRDPPAPLPDTAPLEMTTLVRRCLDKQPVARGNARDVRDALQAFERTLPEQARRTSTAEGGETAVLATPAAPRRLLVLPFANLSPDSDTEYFADGLTEELIADLSQVKSLLVISRTSAMRLKGQRKDVRTLAGELGVDLVLDGSVRKAKGSLRITAHLIDAANDAPLWAGKFTGSDEDLFDLQERLSRRIVDAMRITPSASEAERLVQRPIGDPRAYDLYLRARQKLVRFSAPDLDDAAALLRQGLELLGPNERLWATLGQLNLCYVHWGVRPDPLYLVEAAHCADSVFGLAPDSPYGHALLGGLEMQRGNLQQAVRHLKRASDADPANIEAAMWLIYCYLTAGQPRSARPVLDRVLRADPLTAINHASRGWLSISEGNTEEALRHYQRAFELDPAAPLIAFLDGWALAQAGRHAEAAEHLAAFAQRAPATALGELADGFAHALAGHLDAARAAIGPATIAAGRQDAAIANFLAQVYATGGDIDEAYRWVEQAVGLGYLDYPGLATVTTLYGQLRADARFVRLVLDVQRRWLAFEV